MTARQYIDALCAHYQEKELEKLSKFFRDNDGNTKALGVKFGSVFKTAKEFVEMPLSEIEQLLESDYYEVRMGAVSIMDYQVQQKGIGEAQRRALYDLYLRRHDRINNWDLVDRAAKRVIGYYLYDYGQDRGILYQLARSKNVWERRTAMVATSYFICKGELEYTFKIAEILLTDEHDLIQKAVGSWLREAGKKDQKRLLTFLEEYATTMPKVMLRNATEKLSKQKQEHFRH